MKTRPTRILLLLFAILSLSSCGLKIGQPDLKTPYISTSSNAGATRAPDTAQTSAGKDILYDAAAIGDIVSYPSMGKGCQITVLDVHSEAYILGDRQLLFSKDGYVFICVCARVYNAGQEEMLPYLSQAHLFCADGREIPIHYIGWVLPDNGYYLNEPIRPGESLTGTLVYEMPKNHGDMLFRFPSQEVHDKYGTPFIRIAIPEDQITEL